MTGETIHNEHEMLQNQGTHVHVHEHAHQEIDNDDRIVPPEVVHEGPISPLPAFQGEQFHGPGIRDTPDVHFEDEMDTSRYQHRRTKKIPGIIIILLETSLTVENCKRRVRNKERI